MKFFSLANSDSYSRDDGRVVNILMKEKLQKSFDGITLFLSKGPKGHLNHHYHKNTPEIIIFPNGGKLEIDSKVYDFLEWDCVYLEPREIHGFNHESLKNIIHFAIFLSDKEDRVPV